MSTTAVTPCFNSHYENDRLEQQISSLFSKMSTVLAVTHRDYGSTLAFFDGLSRTGLDSVVELSVVEYTSTASGSPPFFGLSVMGCVSSDQLFDPKLAKYEAAVLSMDKNLLLSFVASAICYTPTFLSVAAIKKVTLALLDRQIPPPQEMETLCSSYIHSHE